MRRRVGEHEPKIWLQQLMILRALQNSVRGTSPAFQHRAWENTEKKLRIGDWKLKIENCLRRGSSAGRYDLPVGSNGTGGIAADFGFEL